MLTDLIPAKARKWVYALAALAALAYGAYQASNGDWKAAAASVLGSLVAELARANTNTPSEPPKA